MHRLRTSIIDRDDIDFASKLKIFDKNFDPKENSQNFEKFIVETDAIINDYEEQIENFKERLNFYNRIETQTITNFSLNINGLNTFYKNVQDILSSSDPDIIALTSVYNEKITELFNSVSQMESQISERDNKLEKFINSVTDLKKIIYDKDLILADIHGIYF